MIHLDGDYYFDSDGIYQFTLYKKCVVSGKDARGKRPKAENIGKHRYEPLGHYATLDQLLSGFVRKAALEMAKDSSVKSLSDLVDRINRLLDHLTFSLSVDGETRTVHPKRVKKTPT